MSVWTNQQTGLSSSLRLNKEDFQLGVRTVKPVGLVLGKTCHFLQQQLSKHTHTEYSCVTTYDTEITFSVIAILLKNAPEKINR